MRREEVQRRIDERKMGNTGPLSMACFDRRDQDCGLWGCQCRCHYVTAAQLRRITRRGVAANPGYAATTVDNSTSQKGDYG